MGCRFSDGAFLNKLDSFTRKMILVQMCRNGGIADVAEAITELRKAQGAKHPCLSPNTVRRYVVEFGTAFTALHDRLVRGVPAAKLQIDEMWAPVYAKNARRIAADSKTAPPLDQVGGFWTWLAMDPDTKLIVGWHVGRRGFDDAVTFTTDVASRVVGRPLISTDAHVVYPFAIQQAFGTDADHVLLKKVIEGWYDNKSGDYHQRIKSFEKVPLNQTKADVALASTSMVERLNGSVRNYVSRCNRRTYRFSKKLPNHINSHAIFAAYYNFVKPHGGLGRDRHSTPAMKAGVTDRVWGYDDLIAEVDRFCERRAVRAKLAAVPKPQYVPLAAGEASPLPYFVLFSPRKNEAKVHKGSCKMCRQGMGRREKRLGPNQWYAFQTEQAAKQCAETLAPMQHSVCSICVVGHYAGNIATGRRFHRDK